MNPRLSEPQSDALPAELLPPQRNKFTLVFAGGEVARAKTVGAWGFADG